MRHIQDPELTNRIHAFLDKKRAKFPELPEVNETKPTEDTRGAKKLSQITSALLKPFSLGS